MPVSYNEAQELLTGVSADYFSTEELLKARYRVAFLAGNFSAAREHYNAMREEKFLVRSAIPYPIGTIGKLSRPWLDRP